MEHRLYSSVKVGPYELSHRVVLAPLTRLRSVQPSDAASDMMAVHYGQRASQGGLLIAEGTAVSQSGRSYLGAPAIYTEEQVAGWRKVTEAVHAKGGRIFVQLFHGGRQSHVFMTGGTDPVAPSVVPEFQSVALTNEGFVPVSPHRELAIDEIAAIVEDFRHAAKMALKAGFDGVELHGANGYLPDQFLQDGSNKRTDRYGGSIKNRCRFLLEVVEALVSVWDADRVAVRIAPSGTWNGMSDSDPQALFAHLALQLDRFGLAYLHIVEPRVKGSVVLEEKQAPVAAHRLRKLFKGTIMAAGGFDPVSAEAIIKSGDADLVSFGRYFISNPDLPLRIQRGVPLSPYDRDTFYTFDARGYVDYPPYRERADAA